jgi:hypothetical protein
MPRISVCLTTLLVFSVLIPNPASAGEKEKPKAFTNSAGMKLLWIPAGEFMMGSNKSAAEIAKQIDSKQTLYRELLDRESCESGPVPGSGAMKQLKAPEWSIPGINLAMRRIPARFRPGSLALPARPASRGRSLDLPFADERERLIWPSRNP